MDVAGLSQLWRVKPLRLATICNVPVACATGPITFQSYLSLNTNSRVWCTVRVGEGCTTSCTVTLCVPIDGVRARSGVADPKVGCLRVWEVQRSRRIPRLSAFSCHSGHGQNVNSLIGRTALTHLSRPQDAIVLLLRTRTSSREGDHRTGSG